jgi:hypothetical protein
VARSASHLSQRPISTLATKGTLLDRETILGVSMNGQCLTRIDALKDFWFDWQHYHPDSSIYRH